jgi:hypothetical protein
MMDKKFRNGNRWMKNWGYSWNDCGKNCDEKFGYTMDFVVKVPAGINRHGEHDQRWGDQRGECKGHCVMPATSTVACEAQRT